MLYEWVDCIETIVIMMVMIAWKKEKNKIEMLTGSKDHLHEKYPILP